MKMNIVTLSLLLPLFLLIHTSNAFDITQLLNKYPDFGTFNSYLTQYSLAASINGRQTITILAVDNGAVSQVNSYSPDVIKSILSVHVILDYYDLAKLQQFASGSSLLTTLFQASGQAKGQQGYLNVTHASGGSVTFSSAMPGSNQQGSSLVKPVMSEPYNISILQVSNVIIPQGIDGSKTSSPPSTTPPSTPSATSTPPPPPPPAPAPATATSTPPPPAPTTATSTPPPTSSTAAPPTPTKATSPPQSSTATPPTTSTSTATSPSSSPPTTAQVPSSAPGSATEPGTLAPESPTKDVPTAGAVDDKPSFKSAATSIEIGAAALICTMALSTLYLGSRI